MMLAGFNDTLHFENGKEMSLPRFVWAIYYGYFYQVYHSLTILYCATGLITNIVNVAVLTRPSMQNPWNFLMSTLAISDMIFLLARASWSVAYYVYPTTHEYVTAYTSMFVNGMHILESSAMFSSEWLNATIGAWRLVAVKWPIRAKRWCSTRRAIVTVVAIAISSFLINLPNAFIEQQETFDWNGTNLTLLASIDMKNATRKLFFYMILLEIFVAFPILTSIGTTAYLIQKIYLFYKNRQVLRTSAQENDTTQGISRTTILLTVLLVLFILTNLPTSILYVAYYTPLPEVLDYRNFFLFFQGLDKTATFFVFVALSREYRHTLRALFFCSSTISSTNSNSNSRDHIVGSNTSAQ